MIENAIIQLIVAINAANETLGRIADALEPPLPALPDLDAIDQDIEAIKARHEMVRELQRRRHLDR